MFIIIVHCTATIFPSVSCYPCPSVMTATATYHHTDSALVSVSSPQDTANILKALNLRSCFAEP